MTSVRQFVVARQKLVNELVMVSALARQLVTKERARGAPHGPLPRSANSAQFVTDVRLHRRKKQPKGYA